MTPRKIAFAMALAIAYTTLPTPLVAQEQAQVERPLPTEHAERKALFDAEIDELAADLLGNHPRPFMHIPESDFRALVEKSKASLSGQSSKADLLWAFNRIIAAIGCGHTRMDYFIQEDKEIRVDQRFPLDVQIFNDRLYVRNGLVNSDRVKPGDEIISVNGLPVEQLLKTIYQRVPADGYNPNFRRAVANTWLTSYLTYALQFPENYEVTLRHGYRKTTLKPLKEWSFPPIVPPYFKCQDGFCAEFEDGGAIAVLSLRHWNYYGEALSDFKAKIDRLRAQMDQNGSKALIIDVRGNLGGSGLAGDYLLRQLSDASCAYFSADSNGDESLKRERSSTKTPFAGSVFYLSNGLTNSATGHFLAMADAMDDGIIVGTNSGNGFTVNDGAADFRSSRLGIRYRIARLVFSISSDRHTQADGVTPHYEVRQTVLDELSGKDAQYEQALQLARESIADEKAR
ncbi:MAG: hypothetical protein KA144_01190 [Xanthomonadaceae bacterium]|nr:hypothetical protein [Xanthomonadaceae bacterium]